MQAGGSEKEWGRKNHYWVSGPGLESHKDSVALSSIRPCTQAGPELEREGPPSFQEGLPMFSMQSGTHPKSVDIVKDGKKEHI